MGIPSSFNPAAATAAFTAQDEAFDASLEKTQQLAQQNALRLEENAAEAAQEKLTQEEQENATTGMTAQTKKLQAPPRSEKIEKAKEVQESVLVRKEDADEFAGDFANSRGGKQYHLEIALLSSLAQELGTTITTKMTSKEIIDHVADRLRTVDPQGKVKEPDISQIDKSLEFLIYATDKQLEKLAKNSPDSPDIKRLKEVSAHIKVAQNDFYNMKGPDGQPNSKAIESTKKIISFASGVIDESGLSAKETLDELRNIIDNPQDPQTIRKHYQSNGRLGDVIEDVKKLYTHVGNELKRVNVKTVEEESLNPTNMPPLEPIQLQQYNEATQGRRAVAQLLINAKNETKVAEKNLLRAGYIEDSFTGWTQKGRIG